MTAPLWTFDEIVQATGGEGLGDNACSVEGISIDTRSLSAGDLFVALTDQRDGHAFVPKAFEAGAAAALVRTDYVPGPNDGPLIRVDETLKGLEALACAARQRLKLAARVIAVTGSVGKTGTKEMLRSCLTQLGPTHAADKSFNNHWGVPLTMARMPRDTQFAAIEIGMNHAGEITPLTAIVRPHVAIVTTVAPVHLEFFSSVEAIAEAKAEIFSGLVAEGTAIINADNPYSPILMTAAKDRGARIVRFGKSADADVRLDRCTDTGLGSELEVSCRGKSYRYTLSIPGQHVAQNSLAVVAALASLDVDVDIVKALAAMSDVRPAPGRGVRSRIALANGEMLIIDESYNANPASMSAALAALGAIPRQAFPRRIAVLGDMLELGEKSRSLHVDLKEAILAAGVDKVFAVGPQMAALYDELPETHRGGWAETSQGLRATLLKAVAAGDALMVKGSLGSNMAPLVQALSQQSNTNAQSDEIV